jgi:hypothetical protein
MVVKRGMAAASGSVIELSNYLEQRISQKAAEYAAVSAFHIFKLFIIIIIIINFFNFDFAIYSLVCCIF